MEEKSKRGSCKKEEKTKLEDSSRQSNTQKLKKKLNK